MPTDEQLEKGREQLQEIKDREDISNDLARRTGASEDQIRTLTDHIVGNRLYVRQDFGKIEYDPSIQAFAPRLFAPPQATGRESPRDKVRMATLLERWINNTVTVPSAPAPQKLTPKQQKIANAAALETKLRAHLGGGDR